MSWRHSKNVAIFGATRQGKSVLANELYVEDRRIGIFFAPDPEPWFSGTKVKSPKQMIRGLQQGQRKFVVPVGLWGDVQEHHKKWVRWLLDSCDKLSGMSVVMVHDESQDLDGSSLKIALKRGLKRGFRNILVTQSPASRQVSLEPLRQCDYYAWVGPAGKMDIEYIDRKDLFDSTAMLENDDHQYQVVTRTGENVEKGYPDNQRYGDG